jgi:hypothetical protein
MKAIQSPKWYVVLLIVEVYRDSISTLFCLLGYHHTVHTHIQLINAWQLSRKGYYHYSTNLPSWLAKHPPLGALSRSELRLY